MGRRLLFVGLSIGLGFLLWFVLTVFYIGSVGFTEIGSVHFKPTQQQKLFEFSTIVIPPIVAGILALILTKDLRFGFLALLLLGVIFAIIFRPTLPFAP